MFTDQDDIDSQPTQIPEDQSIEEERIFSRLRGYWFEARAAHANNRLQQAIDDDFANHIQWDVADAAELEGRGQKACVRNEIKPAVEWLKGTEARTKVDWKVLPRNDGDVEIAETKTKLLKYISDVNKSDFQISRTFADAVTVGVGWMEFGVRSDSAEEPLFDRYESWRNVWDDPLSVELDGSDARYRHRSKIIDMDIAEAMFPTKTGLLHMSKENAFNELGTLYDTDLHDIRQHIDTSMSNLNGMSNSFGRPSYRKVVRLVETWYRIPVNVQIMRGHPQFDGAKFDPANPDMLAAANSGESTLYDAVRMQVRVAVFCNAGLLQDMDSPYQHNRFSLVPLYAYRRGRDNMAYGMPRGARDAQEDINKRSSKALFLLSVNRTVMDDGAVPDLDDYKDEAARPDAIIVKKKGYDLKIETQIELAEEHITLANQASAYIRNISGVTGENLGQETNAVSGKAILARQNQGTVSTASLFDNKRLFMQCSGEIKLSLLEQFYDYSKVVRIVGDRGAQDFMTINEMMPDGTVINPITKSAADFKIAEQDSSETERLAIFDQMVNMMNMLPQEMAASMVDIVVEYSDVPGKDEIVRRIRQINGYGDPNDPQSLQQEEASQQAKVQLAQQMQQLEMALKQADIRSKNALAENNEATSQNTKLDSMAVAFAAALQVLSVKPVVTATAQDLLQGADAATPGQQAPMPSAQAVV